MINNCGLIHRWFDKLPRIKFPFDEKEIPLNGIYVLFEKREKAHNQKDRIVRIGTHTGDNQLRSRLKQHFINENKDRSIFRKNIGRALLSKNKDSFLKDWELDLTTREAKDKYSDSIDLKKQKETEKKVSKYIQNNFSFIVFEVKNKERRLELESQIISTISLCGSCNSSKNWLGNHSPKDKIKESGLWLVNQLYKDSLSDENKKYLKNVLFD